MNFERLKYQVFASNYEDKGDTITSRKQAKNESNL